MVLLVLTLSAGCGQGAGASRPRRAVGAVSSSAPEPAHETSDTLTPRPGEPVWEASGGLLESRGQWSLPAGTQFQETAVGGLSALAYDSAQEVFYALSDDRGEHSPARFYHLKIDLSAGSISPDSVRLAGVTTLRNAAGNPFPAGGIDPEGLVYDPHRRSLFLSSEGDRSFWLDPFVGEISLDGGWRRALTVPGHYLPRPGEGTHSGTGVRTNFGFESLTLLTGSKDVAEEPAALFTATESALMQDGPGPLRKRPSPARILRFDPTSGLATGEFLYRVSPVARDPAIPGTFAIRGLTELLALSPDSLLALERSFSLGSGFTLRLYRVSLEGADNLLGKEKIEHEGRQVRAVRKTLLLDFAAAGLPLDNFEGLCLGPPWPDGRESLFVISDNNFDSTHPTWLLAFAYDSSALQSTPSRRTTR